jgi:hypothetical protein
VLLTAILAPALLLAVRAGLLEQSRALPFDVPTDYLRRAGLAALLIDLVALTSIWRSRKHSLKARLVWTAIVAFVPVLGGLGWFLLGRERRSSESPDR